MGSREDYTLPDLHRRSKFFKEYSAFIKPVIAVQDGNYEVTNPKTGKQVTVKEIYEFGKNEIGLDYNFLRTQELFYQVSDSFFISHFKN